ncbi:acyl-CoA thioesterase [Saxophila tyrrhenica]|uniref:Acyl-CoA thioesterase n=1 Tax=Saxophila tyrrhenica TaxID=1690608 RepID=A0AAV9NV32_9PEZI|nr:acyl-CoA thioesterase [Saxophila tyrrhenica]
MTAATFERTIALSAIGQDEFESVHSPLWTWPNSTVVPGGTLVALAAAAAYETVGSDFAIDTLHTYFVAGPKHDQLLRFQVQRLNDGGRFLTRVVTIKQAGKVVVHVSCSFVRIAAMAGPSMTHAVRRRCSSKVDKINIDDLEVGKNSQGPVMKFQRLSVTPTHASEGIHSSTPDSLTYTSVATVSPSLQSQDPRIHALGIIALSDYHVLDAPPTLHSIPFGLPAIDDHSRSPQPTHFGLFTSLNHTIRFHLHEGFPADELCYIEVNSPWTAKRRAEVQSRIFSTDGRLVASCVQGAYYVLKGDEERSKL